MTPKEKLQLNKLLADFDGVETQPPYKLDWTLFDMRNNLIDYSDDWNLLMSVVNKIIEIDITPAPNWSGFRVEIVPRGYVLISGFPMGKIVTNVSIEGSLNNALFKACFLFIQWLNQQKP